MPAGCVICQILLKSFTMSTLHVSTDFEAFAAQPVPYIIKKNKGADRIASPYSSAPMKDLGLERELQVKSYICSSVKVV